MTIALVSLTDTSELLSKLNSEGQAKIIASTKEFYDLMEDANRQLSKLFSNLTAKDMSLMQRKEAEDKLNTTKAAHQEIIEKSAAKRIYEEAKVSAPVVIEISKIVSLTKITISKESKMGMSLYHMRQAVHGYTEPSYNENHLNELFKYLNDMNISNFEMTKISFEGHCIYVLEKLEQVHSVLVQVAEMQQQENSQFNRAVNSARNDAGINQGIPLPPDFNMQ